jgi:hypothetical protein
MIEKDQTFFDVVYDVFYKVANQTPENIRFLFSYEANYPLINFRPQLELTMPLPKIQDGNFIFEGMIFENSDKGRTALWGLFLASIYHLAAHAAVSKYHVYAQWCKKKTADICWKVIDFIEDIAVERYLSDNHPEIWKNMTQINSLILICEAPKAVKKTNNPNENSKLYCIGNDEKRIEKMKQEILLREINQSSEESILPYADSLYASRALIPENILPYVEHHKDEQFIKFEKKGIEFQADGLFEKNIALLNELWEEHEKEKLRLLRRYKKGLKGLNFDSVVIPSGDLHQFEELRIKILPMLRKMRQQIRMITNIEDDPKSDELGIVNMQFAIQAIASENTSMDIYDRDSLRRAEEAWLILVDSSASMKLKFDKIKEFAICIAEAATELTGKADAWGMYSFDNNFTVLKDFNERYNNEVKARIGSLKVGGLSLLPDALELCSRVLASDPRERKHIFILTDGHPSGYDQIDKRFAKIVKVIEMSSTSLIAVGLSKKMAHSFRNAVKGSDLKQLVSNFITAYRAVSLDM